MWQSIISPKPYSFIWISIAVQYVYKGWGGGSKPRKWWQIMSLPPPQQSRGLVSYFCVNDAILTNGSPSILYITWTNNSTWYISSCKRISVMKMYIDCRCIMHNIIARLNSTLDVQLHTSCMSSKGRLAGTELKKGQKEGEEGWRREVRVCVVFCLFADLAALLKYLILWIGHYLLDTAVVFEWIIHTFFTGTKLKKWIDFSFPTSEITGYFRSPKLPISKIQTSDNFS